MNIGMIARRKQYSMDICVYLHRFHDLRTGSVLSNIDKHKCIFYPIAVFLVRSL